MTFHQVISCLVHRDVKAEAYPPYAQAVHGGPHYSESYAELQNKTCNNSHLACYMYCSARVSVRTSCGHLWTRYITRHSNLKNISSSFKESKLAEILKPSWTVLKTEVYGSRSVSNYQSTWRRIQQDSVFISVAVRTSYVSHWLNVKGNC